LRQAWVNLVSNAVKYSSTRSMPRVEVRCRSEGAETVYSIRDNGVGFDMKYVDKLFGVFQRLHAAHEFSGTGVGLAIVHRIVTRHGGRVWAEGELDRGAAFSFAVPAPPAV
jgi:light-regulated signal transduction histidine kinase (bacteriophytochrome)